MHSDKTMSPKARFTALIVIVTAFAFPALLLLGALRLTLSPEFLRYEYTRPGFPADPYGLSTAARLRLGFFALDYLHNDAPIGFLGDLTMSAEDCLNARNSEGGCPMFSQAALQHMADVKQLINIAFSFAWSLAIAACAIILLAWRRADCRQAMLRGLRMGSLGCLAALATLGVLAAGAWNQAFDGFHELFFAAGTWRFPFSDTLIRLYPERLFIDAAIFIIVLVAAPCLLVLLLHVLHERFAIDWR